MSKVAISGEGARRGGGFSAEGAVFGRRIAGGVVFSGRRGGMTRGFVRIFLIFADEAGGKVGGGERPVVYSFLTKR